MAQAAYTKKVQVSADGGTTWLDVPTTSPTLDLGGDVLDDTVVGNNGFRSRILGIHDWSISCDSNYAVGNAALAAIRSSKLTRSALMARYLPDGVVANGFQGSVVVENFNLSGDVGSLETVAITLQANGALADAS